ncbi:MAG TPA: sugar phosphate isomerase/epimerase family protein [Candidatus Acidoferrales bacterium]|nr:sugar phosphate isomerase/epimerase family protein [Candidatus Acidoferrales bacterium]
MPRDVELLASYWTIAGGAQPHTERDWSPLDFKDRVAAAARAGFRGIGIWHTDLAHTLETRGLPEMKRILDDHGIRHVELEFLTDWFLEGERKRQSDATRQLLMTAAEALGARHIKVGDFFKEKCPMPRLVEGFAGLCREAAEHGTRILFELMPFANIDTLEGAIELVRGAGAANGGIILDTWHVVKLGIPYEAVARMPGEFLLGVELNDGTFQAPWSLHEDTINHRRLCGEGEFDVKGFIAAVEQAGYRGPYGIEVLNAEMRAWPLEKLATRAYETTMAQFGGDLENTERV